MSRAEEICRGSGSPLGLTQWLCVMPSAREWCVHLGGESADRARDVLGEGDRDIVCGVHDQHLQRVVDRHERAGWIAHLGGRHPGRALADQDRRAEIDALVLDRLEDHIGGHKLGQRGGIPGAGRLLLLDDLPLPYSTTMEGSGFAAKGRSKPKTAWPAPPSPILPPILRIPCSRFCRPAASGRRGKFTAQQKPFRDLPAAEVDKRFYRARARLGREGAPKV